jgi:hypothetical protein
MAAFNEAPLATAEIVDADVLVELLRHGGLLVRARRPPERSGRRGRLQYIAAPAAAYLY